MQNEYGCNAAVYADLWAYSSAFDEWEFCGGPTKTDVKYVYRIMPASFILMKQVTGEY
jgi:hypothetical protein